MGLRPMALLLVCLSVTLAPGRPPAQAQQASGPADPALRDTAPPAPPTNKPPAAEPDNVPAETLYPSPDAEDRLVILPEIKREGERHFLSSFKLPDKLVFAGEPVPLDNWQVRERLEYEFYQFLEDEGDSIILAKRTGRCFPPVEKQLAESGLPDDLKFMLLVESKCVAAAYSKAKASGPGSSSGPPANATN
nr:hypothetical protein [Nitrospirota bacterium]